MSDAMRVSTVKWIPAADVMTVVEAAKDNEWSWIWNTRCKYIDLRIDMRDGHCVLKNRDGVFITLDQLKQQYGATP